MDTSNCTKTMQKLLTLVLVRQGDNVLLGMKKKGFGSGRWNGFGGKVETGETIEQAAIREVQEECMVTVNALEKRGILEFSWESKPDEVLQVHIFCVTDFSGTPAETEEMKPQWYKVNEIPFAEMWPDDQYWFPIFLDGKKFAGKFLFGEGDIIVKQELAVVDTI